VRRSKRLVQNEYIVDVEKGRVHYQNRTYGLRGFFEMVDDKWEFVRRIVQELRLWGFNGYTIYDWIRKNVGLEYEMIQKLS